MFYFGARDDDSLALFPSRKADRMMGKGINDVVQRQADRAGVEHTSTPAVVIRAT